jgi:hypothetical protein
MAGCSDLGVSARRLLLAVAGLAAALIEVLPDRLSGAIGGEEITRVDWADAPAIGSTAGAETAAGIPTTASAAGFGLRVFLAADFTGWPSAVGAGVGGVDIGWADAPAIGSTAGAETAAGVPTTASAAGFGLRVFLAADFTGWPSAVGAGVGGVDIGWADAPAIGSTAGAETAAGVPTTASAAGFGLRVFLAADFTGWPSAVGAGVGGVDIGWADAPAIGSTAGAETAAGVPTTASAAGFGLRVFLAADFTGWPSAVGAGVGGVDIGWADAPAIGSTAGAEMAAGVPTTASAAGTDFGLLVFLAADFTGWPSAVGAGVGGVDIGWADAPAIGSTAGAEMAAGVPTTASAAGTDFGLLVFLAADFTGWPSAVGAGVAGVDIGWADAPAIGSTAGAEMAAGVPTTASAAGTDFGLLVFLAADFTGWPSAVGAGVAGVDIGWADAPVIGSTAGAEMAAGVPTTASAAGTDFGLLVFLAVDFTGWPSAVGAGVAGVDIGWADAPVIGSTAGAETAAGVPTTASAAGTDFGLLVFLAADFTGWPSAVGAGVNIGWAGAPAIGSTVGAETAAGVPTT